MTTDIHALSGAYAVDALDPVERADFERHLAECPACQAEVDSLREASALLAETTALTPSAELRVRVLADAAATRPLPPEVAQPSREDAGATVTQLAPRRRRRAASFLAAAAAVVAIGAGGIVWSQVSDDGAGSRVEQIQAASDVRSFTQDIGDGSATVYVSDRLNEAVMVTSDLPAAPSGSEYVMWLRHGDSITPAGVLPDQPSSQVVFSGDAASATGAAVSVEDAGSQPTTPSDDIAATFSFEA